MSVHSQVNNILTDQCLPTKKSLSKLHSLYDFDLFNLNTRQNDNITMYSNVIRTNYYSPNSFKKMLDKNSLFNLKDSFSLLHTNIRSLRKNLDHLENHLLNEVKYKFDIIGLSETKITSQNTTLDINLNIENYNFEFAPTPLSCGGVGMYISNNLNYTILEKTSNEFFQALWIEIHFFKKSNSICGIIYRQHNRPNEFLTYFENVLEKYSSTQKNIYILGDFNIDLLKCEFCTYSETFLLSLQSWYLFPTIDKPTRVYNNSATLIDNILINNPIQGL